MPDVVVFDLFDTLVDLQREELPIVDWGEGPRRSTIGPLHEVVRPLNGMTLPDFAKAVIAANRAYIWAHWAEDREITTEQRFADLLERLGIEEDGLVEQLTEVHVGWLARVAQAPPHHAEVLRRLAERHRLAICSNFSHTPTALGILERDGLLPYFESVVVSADVRYRKPNRRIFERVLSALHVEPDHVLHVGDRLVQDVEGPAALGERTAWITRRVKDRRAAWAEYVGPPPDHVIVELAELELVVS